MQKFICFMININKLSNFCARKFISFLEKRIDRINKQQKNNAKFVKYPITFFVVILFSFIFFVGLFLDFWIGNINKSRLDTFIVVASLISLVINNISKLYETEFFDDYIVHVLKYMAGGVLYGFVVGASIFLVVIATLAIVQPSYLPQFNTTFFLSIVITAGILFLVAFTFLFLSEILLNKRNLFYAIWWIFILVLYLIKIYT
ncbi:hypothetical protein [Neisseria sp. 83E34]|uniref:hypothetical protein n=1 Tax=Neisseria sp. 83E34 TaxID=1692264 RepID=UPI0006CE7DE7|nr:hypothetical protein [Neisseria sp. 83E34]KPN71975.1 hypothetical protein AKG09_04600 [Neisseria sp. 83E34]